jgi:hypothetical protein
VQINGQVLLLDERLSNEADLGYCGCSVKIVVPVKDNEWTERRLKRMTATAPVV